MVPDEPPSWRPLGLIYDDAMNNFSPQAIARWPVNDDAAGSHLGYIHLLFGVEDVFDRWESILW